MQHVLRQGLDSLFNAIGKNDEVEHHKITCWHNQSVDVAKHMFGLLACLDFFVTQKGAVRVCCALVLQTKDGHAEKFNYND